MTAKQFIGNATKDLTSLVGRTIVGVDGVITYDDEVVVYLVLDDGRRAYVERDAKGSGPGYLDVVKPD